MAHSIELLFDEDTEARLTGQWRTLTDAALPSQGDLATPTNRPHLTLVAANRIDAGRVDLTAIAMRLPIPLVVGPPLVLGGGSRLVLARSVAPSTELVSIQALASRLSAALCEGRSPTSLPGRWTPHTTLARRMSAADLTAALTALSFGVIEAQAISVRYWNGDDRSEQIMAGRGC